MDNPLPGAYTMQVNNNSLYIAGDNETGVFYGIQTLLQLLPIPNQKLQTTNYKLSIPQLTVKDYPRFAYRGMHLDVGRHFFPPSFIIKMISSLPILFFEIFNLYP